MKRRVLHSYLVSLLLCACLVSGCSLSPVPYSSPLPARTPGATPGPTPAGQLYTAPAWGYTRELMIADQGVLANGDCYAVYPVFYGIRQQNLNASVKAAFSEYASTLTNCRLDFKIIYNGNGLLSIWAVAHKTNDDEVFSKKPLCFDVWTGMQMNIFDCFLGDPTIVAQTVPDLITEYAQAAGITLISYIPPLDKNQEFYFTDEALVFCYQPYEVASHGDGAPEIPVPLSRILALLADNAPLRRIPSIARIEVS